jgi:uncharacterized protein
MHIYIHGFSSSGNATKGRILKEFLQGKEHVLTPDIPDEPFEAIKKLENLINASNQPVTLWGSSLGGFYALYFTAVSNLKAVLINPTIKPWRDLKPLVGRVKRHNSDERFEWKIEYITQLETLGSEIEIKNINPGNLTLLLAEDDKTLNHKEALEFLDGHYIKLILEKNSSHEFLTFNEVLFSDFKELLQKRN